MDGYYRLMIYWGGGNREVVGVELVLRWGRGQVGDSVGYSAGNCRGLVVGGLERRLVCLG